VLSGDLFRRFLEELKAAASQDWAKVRPEIFGTLFEQSMDAEERHALGAHFTSPVDIMKIVGPTIVSPWRQEIENASTLKKLLELRVRMENFHVLDPACGSGNFLYIAYRELKRLEARLQQRLAEEFRSVGTVQQTLGFVSVRNFFGLDINPFAVELAKVTMEIGHKLAIDELKLSEEALPLSKLDANFRVCDALVDDSGIRTSWPKADVIIGNPPFLGAKRLKPERGPDYADAIRRLYPEVPGMADYCVYWFRRTHDALSECNSADPVAGRAGLVGTQNIRNNQSRVGGLDAIVSTGTVVDAVENQPWSGDAAVQVSIVNWVKSKDPVVVGKEKRLWFVSASGKSVKVPRRRGTGPMSKEYELDYRTATQITSSLSDQIDVSQAATLECNVEP
jgi:type II restriction/modification system DNA methylase subunit YeeA